MLKATFAFGMQRGSEWLSLGAGSDPGSQPSLPPHVTHCTPSPARQTPDRQALSSLSTQLALPTLEPVRVILSVHAAPAASHPATRTVAPPRRRPAQDPEREALVVRSTLHDTLGSDGALNEVPFK